MSLEARALVPSADCPQAAYLAFDDAAEPQLTIYDVAEDSLPTEGLAAALLRKGGFRSDCGSARRIVTPARSSFRSQPRRRVSVQQT